VVFSSEVCSTFTAMSSRTLLSDHLKRKSLAEYTALKNWTASENCIKVYPEESVDWRHLALDKDQ